MTAIHSSILSTIGNTPIVRVNNLGPKNVELYVKLEAFNPMGSVKDRLALAVIEAAERDGSLKPGQTVIEATSGNTGIGLAMVCAQKGYPLVIVMAESFSIERRKLIRFLGAKVILTPASEKGTGMAAKAEELAREHGWFLCRQFENEANANIHSETTAEEILSAFGGSGPDYWISGFGTGGTLKGVSRAFRSRSPNTKIVVAEPDNSPLLATGIRQSRNPDGSVAASHPGFRPHLMQGWSPDFIAKLAEDALDANYIDGFQPVAGGHALECARDLARKEGIFCGISAGATFAAALKVAETAPDGSRILAMLPDTGERYMSTPLFEGVAENMDAEELEIARSTPNYRFDVKAKPAPAPAVKMVEPTRKALQFVEAVTSNQSEPVVLFALEWCEFCWSVRRLFAAAGIDYRSVDLDSVSYQKDDWGGDIRAALRQVTGAPTIPQIFVGGAHVGGATETFDAFNSGDLQKMLNANGVAFKATGLPDAYSFLPKWLHAR
ncbi:MAG: pyridoxal-phosphate dependent enzyme [Rhizobiaceae bacterium]|nr:pyridoxal-phosphate dependent enzyme [Rhizobiaceae bacterium]